MVKNYLDVWGSRLLSVKLYNFMDRILFFQSEYRPPDKNVYLTIIFSRFSTKTYVVGTQKNRLNETVLLSTQNTRLN